MILKVLFVLNALMATSFIANGLSVQPIGEQGRFALLGENFTLSWEWSMPKADAPEGASTNCSDGNLWSDARLELNWNGVYYYIDDNGVKKPQDGGFIGYSDVCGSNSVIYGGGQPTKDISKSMFEISVDPIQETDDKFYGTFSVLFTPFTLVTDSMSSYDCSFSYGSDKTHGRTYTFAYAFGSVGLTTNQINLRGDLEDTTTDGDNDNTYYNNGDNTNNEITDNTNTDYNFDNTIDNANTGNVEATMEDYNTGDMGQEDTINRRKRQAESGDDIKSVAICAISQVYPIPNYVKFEFENEGHETITVPEKEFIDYENLPKNEITDVKVELKMLVTPSLDGQNVRCVVDYPNPGMDMSNNQVTADSWTGESEYMKIEVLHFTTEVEARIVSGLDDKNLVKKGNTVDIECSANGNPRPESYQLYVNKNGAEEMIEMTGGASSVENVQVNEDTSFYCKTNNISSNNVEAKVKYIAEEVTVTVASSNVAGLGDEIRLECSAGDSYPAPTITWITPQGSKAGGYEFVIGSATVKDHGKYQCKLENDAGTSSSNEVEISVQQPCDAKITSNVGQSPDSAELIRVTLTCTYSGNPECSATFHPTAFTKTGTRESRNENGKITETLFFDTNKQESPVNVWCVATNDIGFKRSTNATLEGEAFIQSQPSAAGPGTGVIVLIIIIVIIVVVGVPVGCYMVNKKRKAKDSSGVKGKEADLESSNDDDETEKLNAQSEPNEANEA